MNAPLTPDLLKADRRLSAAFFVGAGVLFLFGILLLTSATFMRDSSQWKFGNVWMTVVVPVAGLIPLWFWGSRLGIAILDPLRTRRWWQALLRGAVVGLLSMLTYFQLPVISYVLFESWGKSTAWFHQSGLSGFGFTVFIALLLGGEVTLSLLPVCMIAGGLLYAYREWARRV